MAAGNRTHEDVAPFCFFACSAFCRLQWRWHGGCWQWWCCRLLWRLRRRSCPPQCCWLPRLCHQSPALRLLHHLPHVPMQPAHRQCQLQTHSTLIGALSLLMLPWVGQHSHPCPHPVLLSLHAASSQPCLEASAITSSCLLGLWSGRCQKLSALAAKWADAGGHSCNSLSQHLHLMAGSESQP